MSELSDIAAHLKVIATALQDKNAIDEYWAQIGWASTERASKNQVHIRMMEEVLKNKNLEELVTAHSLAVNNMLTSVFADNPLVRVNLDLSPSPFGIAANNTTQLPDTSTPPVSILPAPVLSGSATANSITLTWTGVANATSYKIYRDGTLLNTRLASLPRTYTISGTNDATLYTFQVTTVGVGNLESARSNTYTKNPFSEAIPPTIIKNAIIGFTIENAGVNYNQFEYIPIFADGVEVGSAAGPNLAPLIAVQVVNPGNGLLDGTYTWNGTSPNPEGRVVVSGGKVTSTIIDNPGIAFSGPIGPITVNVPTDPSFTGTTVYPSLVAIQGGPIIGTNINTSINSTSYPTGYTPTITVVSNSVSMGSGAVITPIMGELAFGGQAGTINYLQLDGIQITHVGGSYQSTPQVQVIGGGPNGTNGGAIATVSQMAVERIITRNGIDYPQLRVVTVAIQQPGNFIGTPTIVFTGGDIYVDPLGEYTGQRQATGVALMKPAPAAPVVVPVTYESVTVDAPTIAVGDSITVTITGGDANAAFTYTGQAIGSVVGGNGILQGGGGTLNSNGTYRFTVNPVTYANWVGGPSMSYRYDFTFTESNRTARVDFNVVDPNYVAEPAGGYQIGDNFPGKGIIISKNVFGYIFGPVGVSTYPAPHQQYNVLSGEVDWRPGLAPTTGVSGNIYLSGADMAYADDYYRPTSQELAIHDQYLQARLSVIRSFFPEGSIIVSDGNGSSSGGVTIPRATVEAAILAVAQQNGWAAPVW